MYFFEDTQSFAGVHFYRFLIRLLLHGAVLGQNHAGHTGFRQHVGGDFILRVGVREFDGLCDEFVEQLATDNTLLVQRVGLVVGLQQLSLVSAFCLNVIGNLVVGRVARQQQ